MREKMLRQAIVTASRDLVRIGLNQGTAGNISARFGTDMLITPSGVPSDTMTSDMIVRMPLDGEYGAWSGPMRPSSEWRLHLDVMRARSEIGAVVHTHALYATTLSMLHKPIPATHYMVAAFGGPTVRCTPYATFGTKELSENVVEGLVGRSGVLLGNHGMVVLGFDLAQAMWRAVELETLAKMHYLAMSAGRPFVLPEDEVTRVVERFKSYGPVADVSRTTPVARARAVRASTKAKSKVKSKAPKPAKLKSARTKAPKSARRKPRA